MAVFTSREAAEEFAREDPFVLNGVVGRWQIREWRRGLPSVTGRSGRCHIGGCGNGFATAAIRG